jgi:hypothetical protein
MMHNVDEDYMDIDLFIGQYESRYSLEELITHLTELLPKWKEARATGGIALTIQRPATPEEIAAEDAEHKEARRKWIQENIADFTNDYGEAP